MKPCVCVVIVLFFYTITRLEICFALFQNTNQHLGHIYLFLFYRLSGPISDVGGQKTI